MKQKQKVKYINMISTMPFSKQDATWILNDDGSFGYTSGSIALLDCRPAFNGHPVSAKSVDVIQLTGGGEIIYHLKNGRIRLIFSTNADSLVLRSFLDMPVAPHWFQPIAYARVQGADRYFKQGIGFAGPSGIIPVPQTPKKRESPQLNEAWAADSYLVSGFLTPSEQALAIGACRHDRFLQRSSYRNRPYRYNLIDRHLESDDLLFEAGFATEELPLAEPLALPDLHFVAGIEPFSTYRHFAENVAQENQVRFNNQPHYQVCTFWEWMTEYTQERLNDLVAGWKAAKPAIPIETIQVDGGFCTYGDWLQANHRFPQGIQHMADTILHARCKAGIWIGPFIVATTSQTAKDHPEWLLRNLDGTIHVAGKLDEYECYILDTTHPEAFAYLRQVFRTYRKMGFSYYKTDFMEWGLRDRTRFLRHDNRTTSVEHMTEVIRMIREEIGPDSFWVACIAVYPQFIGYADAVRISNDVPANWREGSHGNLIQEAFTMHYLQQVLWQNDPDCLFLRDVDSGLNSKLTRDETYLLAYWNAMIGGFITASDRFHKITPEYLKLWRFLQPGKQQMSCRFPYWSGNKKLKVAVRDYADGTAAVLIINPTTETIREEYQVKELLGEEDAWLFLWQPGASTPLGQQTKITAELAAHQPFLLYANPKNQPPAPELTLFGETVEGLLP
ncbi:MAG: glycoside hydrolase family 36 protein [bacterium]